MATAERIPPQNIEAEQAVLGAMLLSKEAIAHAAEKLKPEDFYRDAHRRVFEAMLELFRRDEAVDLVTVTEQLKKTDQLDKAGGIAFVTSLANTVPTASNIQYHTRIVLEKAQLRHLINTSTEIAGRAYEDSEELDALMSDAAQKILAVTGRGSTFDITPISELVMDVFRKTEDRAKMKNALTGLASGFVDLDKLTSGFQPSDLILVAARPSMGKTALALNMAEHIAENNKAAVAFFSLEMGPNELVTRLLSSRAGVRGQALRRGDMTEADYTKLVRAAGVLKKLDLFIDSSPSLTPLDIKSRCQLLRAKAPNLSAVFVDYIQLLSAGSDKQFKDNRVQEISYISRSLKSLAVELDIPVIALSQLNRQAEQGTDKGSRPQLSHLRESGSIEQDADIVMMLYRPSYYNKEAATDEAEVIIAKQRNGPTGTVKMIFNPEYARFVDGQTER